MGLALLGLAPLMVAQARVDSALTMSASLSLPETPGFLDRSATPGEVSSSNDGMPDSPDPQAAAVDTKPLPATGSRYSMTIEPGQTAQPLRAGDKFVMGFRENVSLFSAAGWVLSAGYSQVTNDSPNYGTNRGAFAARFGAAVARNVSENVFGDGILAPIMHEDPRYYRMGKGNSFFKRLAYAGTRAIITRTDAGHTTPNFSNVGGNLLGAVLTNAYYPKLNQGVYQTALTFGSSVGGTALGFVVTEFADDALEMIHLKKPE